MVRSSYLGRVRDFACTPYERALPILNRLRLDDCNARWYFRRWPQIFRVFRACATLPFAALHLVVLLRSRPFVFSQQLPNSALTHPLPDPLCAALLHPLEPVEYALCVRCPFYRAAGYVRSQDGAEEGRVDTVRTDVERQKLELRRCRCGVGGGKGNQDVC